MKSLIGKSTNTKQPMFFGEDLGLKRYDIYTHNRIKMFYKNQIQFYWIPEEIDISSKDRLDFNKLSDLKKFIVLENLSYQILLDSVQTRGIQHIKQYTSISEIESFCTWWEAFEDLHARSYTHIIEGLFAEPGEVLDKIMSNKNVLKRASGVTKYYDDLINNIPDENLDALKKKLYLTLMSINILEGIRFYVSFACTYAMAENGVMEGNAKIIEFINRDENLHLGFTQYVLKKLMTDEFEGFTHIAKECEEIVYDMFRDAANEEIEWANYLFSKGDILGLNANILTKYMRYLTNIRMNAIGLKPIFEDNENPITWIDKYIKSEGVQPAPQETEITSYLIGAVKNDIATDDFDSFEL